MELFECREIHLSIPDPDSRAQLVFRGPMQDEICRAISSPTGRHIGINIGRGKGGRDERGGRIVRVRLGIEGGELVGGARVPAIGVRRSPRCACQREARWRCARVLPVALP